MSISPHDSPDFTLAILAGGAARRLDGVDKGLMAFQGRPMIEWVLESLNHAAHGRCLIVANRNLVAYSRYAPTISDRFPDQFAGPLAGVAVALSVCETEWLYTAPVDSLRPRLDVFEYLRVHADRHRLAALVAHDGSRRQPLFAIYRRELAESASRALDAGNGVSFWQDSISCREIDLSDLRIDWINLNTIRDFSGMLNEQRDHD
jgi:molybdenum cofactor guanylyltransferase